MTMTSRKGILGVRLVGILFVIPVLLLQLYQTIYFIVHTASTETTTSLEPLNPTTIHYRPTTSRRFNDGSLPSGSNSNSWTLQSAEKQSFNPHGLVNHKHNDLSDHKAIVLTRSSAKWTMDPCLLTTTTVH
jgi:hypothetical protein